MGKSFLSKRFFSYILNPNYNLSHETHIETEPAFFFENIGTKKKAIKKESAETLVKSRTLAPSNRSDVIRTRDLYVPNVALYQAEPHLDYLIVSLRLLRSGTSLT